MIHNVLVVAAAALPARAGERRLIGLPPPAASAAPWVVRLEALPGRLAATLARLMRSAGGSARPAPGRALVLGGDEAAFRLFLDRAGRRREGREAAAEVGEAMARCQERPRSLGLARGALPLGRTLVMGVLNVTPDSFSDGGRYKSPRAAVGHALRMADEGADLIDVGGESTRPGARPVRLQEELRRVLPVLEALVPALRARGTGRGANGRGGLGRPLVSIDTTKSEVARRAADAGADLVNDVSGMTFDPAMPAAVAESGLPVVIQHIRGTPRTMRKAARYTRLLPEIAAFLRRRIEAALRAGVREDRIVIDPGIGFGKRRRDSLAVIRHLHVLRSLGRPILVGASRKSFLGAEEELPPDERLEASLAAEALAIAGGADIIRAHDVKQAVRAARLCDATLRVAAARP